MLDRRVRKGWAGAGVLALLAACSGEPDPRRDSGVEDRDPVQSSGSAGRRDAGTGAAVSVDPNEPAAPGVAPTYAPKFPGAGTSGADAPLTNGKLCDYVPAKGAPSPNDITKCFFGPANSVPSATLEQVLECVEGKDLVHIRLSFNPAFVDNTYGAGAIGWPHRRGHTWADLYKSDHAEIVAYDTAGKTILQFKQDYVTADLSAPSGYGTLGVRGGDGKVLVGDAAWVVNVSTSIDRNLNERGYGGYLVDSPLTDASYTPNPAAPDWDFRVVYESWIDVKAFGAAGFGGARIEFVHASPAKGGNDTIDVKEGKCPPPFCTKPEGCDATDQPPKCVTQPDMPCNDDPPVPPPPPGDACVPSPDVLCGTPTRQPPDPPPSECDGGPCVLL